jgi:hypothetical protein
VTPTIRVAVRTSALVWLGVLLGCAGIASACDPGVRYRPQGWQPIEGNAGRWSTSVRGVTIQQFGIGDLIGARGITAEFEIRNQSNHVVILDSATLIAVEGTQDAELPDHGALDARSVQKAETRRIPIGWSFSKPASEALGESPRIVLTFRFDDEREQLAITYERAR